MKVRIKFSKTGAAKFIGHLDTMRYFQKAIRRAGIDIAYSAGFSPHQIMSFAAPLGVGITSRGEYFDIELRTPLSAERLRELLQEAMTEDFSILQVTLLSDQAANAMSSVAAASYRLTFREGTRLPNDWLSQLNDFYQSPSIPYLKTTKKGSRELDLKPLIYQMEASPEGIYIMVNASSSGNIKPEFLLEAFFGHKGISLPEFALCIHREETYGNQGTDEHPQFVPLGHFL